MATKVVKCKGDNCNGKVHIETCQKENGKGDHELMLVEWREELKSIKIEYRQRIACKWGRSWKNRYWLNNRQLRPEEKKNVGSRGKNKAEETRARFKEGSLDPYYCLVDSGSRIMMNWHCFVYSLCQRGAFFSKERNVLAGRGIWEEKKWVESRCLNVVNGKWDPTPSLFPHSPHRTRCKRAQS